VGNSDRQRGAPKVVSLTAARQLSVWKKTHLLGGSEKRSENINFDLLA